MRILLAIESCGGGSGRHIIDLAAGLLARDHEVTLVYSPLRAEAGFQAAINQLPGLKLHALPMERAVSVSDAARCYELRRFIAEAGPFDVLHGQSSKAGALMRLARIGNRTPVIYTPHAPITMDPEMSAFKRSVYRVIERMLAGLCERIICVAPLEYDHLLSLGFPRDKLRVVCNGLGELPAVDREAIRQKLNLKPDALCFGLVGRVSHQKAVDRAVSAFARVCEQAKDARLVIVGDGPDLGAVKMLAENLDIADKVMFTGAANGAEMMTAFDVFLLPSRYEAMPYVLLEAAAKSLPIIMTDVGGAHLVVRDGVNGRVIPQTQLELLEKHMIELAEDSQLRNEMAFNSAQIATEFSLGNMVEGTLAVYEELLIA